MFSYCWPGQAVGQTVKLPMISAAMLLMSPHCNVPNIFVCNGCHRKCQQCTGNSTTHLNCEQLFLINAKLYEGENSTPLICWTNSRIANDFSCHDTPVTSLWCPWYICHRILKGFITFCHQWASYIPALTHCGLGMPYGDRYLGQHWLR